MKDKKITKYFTFLINILLIILLDILLIKSNKYFSLKYNNSILIYGILTGTGIYLFNMLLKKIKFINNKKNDNANNALTKSSILKLLEMFSIPIGTIMIILFLLSVVSLEEIIFRKYLLGYLIFSINMHATIAITVVSILYAIIHFNLKNFIPLFIMGLIFSILVIYTNSLLSAIIAHFVNNIIILVLYKFKKNGKNIAY